MSDIIDRLKGNGERWTFAEIIDEITTLRAKVLQLSPRDLDAPLTPREEHDLRVAMRVAQLRAAKAPKEPKRLTPKDVELMQRNRAKGERYDPNT